MGIGEEKTPKAFVNGCNVFVYTENLTPKEKEVRSKSKIGKTIEKKKTNKLFKESEPIPIMKEAFELAVKEDGWANLAEMGTQLRKLDPGFDPRTFGHNHLSQLIKAYPKIFEIKTQDKSGLTVPYVKIKE
jgi:hypothetical protein